MKYCNICKKDQIVINSIVKSDRGEWENKITCTVCGNAVRKPLTMKQRKEWSANAT